MNVCAQEKTMQNDKKNLSRPSKDFIHDNNAIVKGLTFTVKYVGCIEVYNSMKILDFQTRSEVAR